MSPFLTITLKFNVHSFEKLYYNKQFNNQNNYDIITFDKYLQIRHIKYHEKSVNRIKSMKLFKELCDI